MRPLFSLLIALIAAWLGVASAGPVHAASCPAVHTHNYDGHHRHAATHSATAERGPPPSCYTDTTSHAVDRSSHGALARPAGPTPRSTTTSTTPAGLVRVARATGTTSERAQAIGRDLSTLECWRVAAETGTSVFRTPRLGAGSSELEHGLDPARFAAGDQSAYVGDEAAARTLAHPNVGSYENGYTRFDMHPDFESEFSKFKYNYAEGGPGSFEYQIPQSMIPRFNELTLSRTWIPFE
ncbi:hypothetical protein GCM10028801_01990 [Nocardioides maradonensis]